MANIWRFRGGQPTAPKSAPVSFPAETLAAADGSPLLAQLLANRGLTEPDDIRAFLDLDRQEPSSGWELPDMEAAVNRILAALDAREPILIYGDFDVDGITGTSILYETFKKHLGANVSFYIPDRATEGHGLNSAALIRLTSSRQIKLVITTDTGITNFSEISLLNGLGVHTIVTDHHALPENLPPAVANVNSQRLERSHPMADLCGAGVAFKLCEILLEKRLSDGALARRAADSLLDLAAVGTVVDMVPLLRENRHLVHRGLEVLNRRQRPGLNELLEQAGHKPDSAITSETLGFTIGPRLNALGRLERADQGVELLTGEEPERLRIIAAHLEHLNRCRRDLCDKTFLEAESHLMKSGGLDGRRAIILASPGWNPGIIGIVASRLIEKHHVPTFLMVVDEAKEEVRCSARSIPGFHLHDELQALSHYFVGFGGHSGAGGFTIPLARLESFKRELHAICDSAITDEQMRPIIDVDARLDWSQINPRLITLLDRLSPCGMGNPAPRFVLEDVTVSSQRYLGEDERHIKLILTAGGNATPLEGLIWNFGRKERFDPRTPYRFVVSPGLNTFNGTTKVQLIIEDYQTADESSPVISMSAPSAASRPARLADARANSSEAPEAPVDVKGTPAPSRPGLSASAPESGGTLSSGPQWIDHRGRDSVDLFVSQLMTSLEDGRTIALYHEGKQPEIPFLDEQGWHDRLRIGKVDELILWDLPPSPEEWDRLLTRTAPKTIHLVGGKYGAVPVHPAPQNYLKLMLQTLRREAARTGESELTMPVDAFAAQLAMTEAVIVQGLVLLTRMGFLKAKLALPTDETHGPEGQPSLTGMGGNGQQLLFVRLVEQPPAAPEDIGEWLEYLTFRQALKEVGHFRGWLLKTSLATIKSVLSNSSIVARYWPTPSEKLQPEDAPSPVTFG